MSGVRMGAARSIPACRVPQREPKPLVSRAPFTGATTFGRAASAAASAAGSVTVTVSARRRGEAPSRSADSATRRGTLATATSLDRSACAPKWMTVTGHYNVRGGIEGVVLFLQLSVREEASRRVEQGVPHQLPRVGQVAARAKLELVIAHLHVPARA